MSLIDIEGQSFKGVDYSIQKLPKGEYDNCTFVLCNFADSDLLGVSFIDCAFEDCNLSLTKVSGTSFKDVRFKGCKMVGVHFEGCNPFLLTMHFESCQLNLASFYKLALKKTQFKNCSLQEVEFTEADCTNATFADCDFAGAIFSRTNLEKADFRTAFNYAIDPEINRIKKAKFSLMGVAGLLNKYGIEISN